MHNRLMLNVGPFFYFSDLSQFLHVGFILVNKHCPVSLVCSSFSRNNVCKKLSFPSGIFWTSFVERETKKPFVSLNNEVSEASYQPLAVRADTSNVLV